MGLFHFFKPNVEKMKKKRDIEGLIEELGSPGQWVSALNALVEIKDPKAVEPLIALLREQRSGRDVGAAIGLGELGDVRAVEPLLQALKGEERLAVAAMRALVKIKDPRAVKSLLQLLDDHKHAECVYDRTGHRLIRDRSEPRCYVAAGRALASIGEAAVNPLVENLDHGWHCIRGKKAEVLGMIGDPRAVEPLVRIVMRGLNDDPEVDHYWAIWALGEIGDTRAVETLIGWIERQLKEETRDQRFRIVAAEALGKIGGRRAVPTLVHLLQTRFVDSVEAAARVLGEMRDPRAVDPLCAALRGGYLGTTYTAIADALGKIGDQKAIPFLKKEVELFEERHSYTGEHRALTDAIIDIEVRHYSKEEREQYERILDRLKSQKGSY